MFQKIQKKIQEFLQEKGQGIVEYALILGFVAVIAVFILNRSNVNTNVQKNLQNMASVASEMDAAFSEAKNGVAPAGEPS